MIEPDVLVDLLMTDGANWKRTMILRRIIIILLTVISFGCDSDDGDNNNSSTNNLTNNTTNNNNTSTNNTTNNAVGSVYYLDSSSGLDTNNGITEDTPFRTIQRLSEENIPENSRILFKRGEVWNESLEVSTSFVTVDAYGTGDKPILYGARQIENFSVVSENIYVAHPSFEIGEGPGHIASDGVVMKFIPFEVDVETTLGAADDRSFTYDIYSETLYFKYENDISSADITYSALYRGITVDGCSDVNINNIDIEGFSLHGIEFRNCTGCNADSVHISNIGGASLGEVQAGNGIEYGGNSIGGKVSHSVIENIFDSCLSPQTYDSDTLISEISFEDTTVSECGFSGVEISVLSNGGNSGSAISNVTLTNLVIRNTGKGWSGRRYGTEGHGVRIMADGGAGIISDTHISNVIVENSIGNGVFILGETGSTIIEKSSVSECNEGGISFAGSTGTVSPYLTLTRSLVYNNGGTGLIYNCPDCYGLTMLHNTFSDNNSINAAFFSNSLYTHIQNNIFSTTTAMTHFYAGTELSQINMDNNCYSGCINMIGYSGDSFPSLEAFRDATGFESYGTENENLNLVDAIEGDFNLMSESICIGLGEEISGLATDYAGNMYENPPSAGAFEYIP